MPADPHPFQTPYNDRDAAALLAATKLHVRQTVADADEVRNTDFSGQYGGLYVRSNAANYNIDTEDLTADDGVNVIIDGGGNHWVKIVDTSLPTSKLVTATGDVTIADDESSDEIEINNTSGAAINVYLPSAAVRLAAIIITDVGGNAATYPITVLPKAASGQTIMTGASWVIDSNGGGIRLTPNSAQTGYK